VHFSRSLPSNSWWQTMVGWQVLSRPSAAEGGGRRTAFTGPATQPYSATEVDGCQRLSRVSQNRAAVQNRTRREGGGEFVDAVRALDRVLMSGIYVVCSTCRRSGSSVRHRSVTQPMAGPRPARCQLLATAPPQPGGGRPE
jgi:hypothetical protein